MCLENKDKPVNAIWERITVYFENCMQLYLNVESAQCLSTEMLERPTRAVMLKQASACNTDTTPTQPHRNSNTHRTKNNTTNVVIQQNSRKLLMMGILMSETC